MVLIGISADFSLLDGSSRVYWEPDFPVVELAADLGNWLRNGFASHRVDFEFDSMSTPEPGWIWIRRYGSGWRVGSLHQEQVNPEIYSDDQIRQIVSQFIQRVTLRAEQDLGIDVAPFVGWRY